MCSILSFIQLSLLKKQTFSKAHEAHHTYNTTNKGLQSLTCIHAKTMLLNSCLRDLLWSSIQNYFVSIFRKEFDFKCAKLHGTVINTLLQQQLHNQSILLYFFERKTQHHWYTNLFGSSYHHLAKINQVAVIFWLFLRKSVVYYFVCH